MKDGMGKIAPTGPSAVLLMILMTELAFLDMFSSHCFVPWF
jgi:hypothetical protein